MGLCHPVRPHAHKHTRPQIYTHMCARPYQWFMFAHRQTVRPSDLFARCIYICVYMCVYVCLYTSVCAFVCIRAYLDSSVGRVQSAHNPPDLLGVYIHVCICVYMSSHTSVCVFVCVFVCVCVCVCVCLPQLERRARGKRAQSDALARWWSTPLSYMVAAHSPVSPSLWPADPPDPRVARTYTLRSAQERCCLAALMHEKCQSVKRDPCKSKVTYRRDLG